MKKNQKLGLGLGLSAVAGAGLYAFYQYKETKRQRDLLNFVKKELADGEEIKTSWLMETPLIDNIFQGGIILNNDGRMECLEFEVDDSTLEIFETGRKYL